MPETTEASDGSNAASIVDTDVFSNVLQLLQLQQQQERNRYAGHRSRRMSLSCERELADALQENSSLQKCNGLDLSTLRKHTQGCAEDDAKDIMEALTARLLRLKYCAYPFGIHQNEWLKEVHAALAQEIYPTHANTSSSGRPSRTDFSRLLITRRSLTSSLLRSLALMHSPHRSQNKAFVPRVRKHSCSSGPLKVNRLLTLSEFTFLAISASRSLNPIRHVSVRRLVSGHLFVAPMELLIRGCPSLEACDISMCNFGPSAFRRLLPSLALCPALIKLDLRGNRLGQAGVRSLAAALDVTPSCRLQSLALDGWEISASTISLNLCKADPPRHSRCMYLTLQHTTLAVADLDG